MSKKYWEDRAAQRELESQIIADKYIAKIDEKLRETQQSVLREIESFYGRYAIENQMTIQEARKYLTAKELKDFRNIDLKRFKAMSLEGNPEYDRILNAASYRVRISRLEALNLRIEMQMVELYGNYNGLQQYAYTGLGEVYENTYYKTMYEFAKIGVIEGAIEKISDGAMRDILSFNWSGKEFSKRIWGHEKETMITIRKELEKSFASGRSIQRTTKAITDRIGVSRSRAITLIRTESNFFNSLAAHDSYKDAGIEQYEILATLDSRTSNICRDQDKKVYKTSEYNPGTTAPPFHVNCRSTTVAYFNESEYTDGEKRQSSSGLVKDMSYQDWFDKYVK